MDVVTDYTNVTIPQNIVPWTHDLTQEVLTSMRRTRNTSSRQTARAASSSESTNAEDVNYDNSDKTYEDGEEEDDDDGNDVPEITAKEKYEIESFVKFIKRSGTIR